MARIHGPTTQFQGQRISIRVAAFLGRMRNDEPECAGFHHHAPARSDEILRYTFDNGRVMRKVAAHVVWSDDGVPKILPAEERP